MQALDSTLATDIKNMSSFYSSHSVVSTKLEMDIHQETQPTPHVAIFPLPIQGPVNCMLKLAELILTLTQPAISLTFIITDYIQRRLDLHSSAAARLARFGPAFRFETISDGLGPDENPRGAEQLVDLTNNLGAQAQADGSRLRELLTGPERKPVSCVIGDGFFGFMVDVAKEIGVPLLYFDTVSPCGLWTYLCVPLMLQAGDLPFQGDDLDAPIKSIPGMNTYLRRRDLPSFCRDYDPNSKIIQLILKQAENYPKAQGHILNTFEVLESELLSHMRVSTPNTYTVGPLHLSLKKRVIQDTSKSSFSNSLWQEDRSSLTWLDAQPSKSVVFVSIGSLAVMSKDQVIEFWYGLLNSKTRFLWVRRPNSILGHEIEDIESEVSSDVIEATKQRGYITSWVPQEEVLAHSAIGGFLTHSGWNSTLESIVEGVPMICWPFFVDQQVNSRLVSEVWKVGLDMKDTCNRDVIEKMVRDVMEIRKDEFLAKADNLATLAIHAVNEGGSSYNNLARLINDIKFMRFSIPTEFSS